MNNWTQTHLLVGYAGYMALAACALAYLAFATRKIQRAEVETERRD